jgi:hypothetical protein
MKKDLISKETTMTEIEMLEELVEDQTVEEAKLVLNVMKKDISPTIVQINNFNIM